MYEEYVKHKWISCLDLDPVSRVCDVYSNVTKPKTQNTRVLKFGAYIAVL